MKFSDQFLESYAALFGKESADSFLMHNLDKYVPASEGESGSNAGKEASETQEKPDTAASKPDLKEDKEDKG